MKQALLLFLLLLINLRVAYATAQTPDILLYHGDTLFLEESPLEEYFATKKDNPSSLSECHSTNNWRGFVATWVLENQQLYLVGMNAAHADCPEDVRRIYLRRWFRTDAQGRVKANWFSGRLTLMDPASAVKFGYLCQWHIQVQKGEAQASLLPTEWELWKALPFSEMKRRYCQIRSLLTPEERHYSGIHDLPLAQVWVKIDTNAPEPVTIIAADVLELEPMALRIVRQYLKENPPVSSAQEKPWALPLVFGSDSVPCDE